MEGGVRLCGWCGFALFLVRFCGNFHYNSWYCGFKTVSGLRLFQLLGCGFGEKNCLRLWHYLERSASGCFASASQVFCFATHQSLLYQFINSVVCNYGLFQLIFNVISHFGQWCVACEYSRLSFAPATTCENELRVSHVVADANEGRLYSQAKWCVDFVKFHAGC